MASSDGLPRLLPRLVLALELGINISSLDEREYLMIVEGLLLLWKPLCCDPSFELSQSDSSDEGLQLSFYAD